MKIRIHYHRSDENYEPWSLWIWPENYSGQSVEFTEEDDYGRVATVEFPGKHTRVGFVIRSHSWEKDIDADRYIEEFIAGTGEVWLRDGDPEVYTIPPSELRSHVRVFQEIKLTVHYHRYDHNYNGWNLWVWDGDGLGQEVPFITEDPYGVIGRAVFRQQTDAAQIGFVVRRSVSGNEWFAKDGQQDREIPLYHTDEQGNLHIWLMQEDPRIYYHEKDVDRIPKILKAEIDDERLIYAEVNIPVPLQTEPLGGFQLLRGKEIEEIEDVTAHGDFAKGIRKVMITTVNPLDINEQYTLKHETHGKRRVDFRRIFDCPAFDQLFFYDGDDLGAQYTPHATQFRVWAPTALNMVLRIYAQGKGGHATEYPMEKDVAGTWLCVLDGDRHGTYYTYAGRHQDHTFEVVDPYAKACGVNGKRGMVVDLKRTNPPKWTKTPRPKLTNFTESIIYEMHVRDLSIHPDSGITNKGKYLGVIEPKTQNSGGQKTGLAHLKELGVNHLQLLPVFDFISVDEEDPNSSYNWGYDPLNYNVPEGSYSLDPHQGEARLTEFKQMIQGLHRAGFRVIMDVVYNHTAQSMDANLNQLVPGYYYRHRPDGSFANGSGCGNELADERSMVRKLIVDSVVYWAKEYKIDGFRFDLMGLHHLKTMKAIRKALDKIDPTILIFGEGWGAGESTLPASVRALKENTVQLKGIGSFCNDLRDGIKGHVFHLNLPGFIQGAGFEETIKFGAVGATHHPQIHYGYVGTTSAPWALEPAQCINYTEAHDNLTLWDKLAATSSSLTEEERVKMQKLANAIVLTSQGIPFLHAGQEFARTKNGDYNSYRSPDQINQIDWDRKASFRDVFEYTRGLIALRKDHPAFKMTTTKEIQDKLSFLPMPAANMVGFVLGPHAGGDLWKSIVVIYNANHKSQTVSYAPESWVTIVNEQHAGITPLAEVVGPNLQVAGCSCTIFVDLASFRGN